MRKLLLAIAATLALAAADAHAQAGAAAGQAGGATGNGGYGGGDGTGMSESGLGGGGSDWSGYGGFMFGGMAANQNTPSSLYTSYDQHGNLTRSWGANPSNPANNNVNFHPQPPHGPGPGRSYSPQAGEKANQFFNNFSDPGRGPQGFGGGHFTDYDPALDPFGVDRDFMNLGVFHHDPFAGYNTDFSSGGYQSYGENAWGSD